MPPRIVVLRGDGIGPAVVDEALRVLDAAGFRADWLEADIGWSCWRRAGQALPDETVRLLEAHRVGLFGAITSKGKPEAEAELAPELRGRGLAYESPIVALRRALRLEAGIRPCRTWPGNPANFIRRGPGGAVEEPAIDAAVVFQSTEDHWAGIEFAPPSPALRAALGESPRFAPFLDVPPDDLALSVRPATRGASRRIAEVAFEHARRRGLGSVTLCEKPTVLRETSGLMEAEARLVAERFPEIAFRALNADAAAARLARRPEEFGVLLAGNTYGDVLSDLLAGLAGGLGFAPSASLSPDGSALFEPTHGSAPALAAIEPAIANPVAAILAAKMMLDHLGDADRARRVEAAVASVVRAGRVRTYDMAGLRAAPDAVARGAATTRQMGDAVIAALG